MCVLIFLLLTRNLSLWFELNKMLRGILLFFAIPGHVKGNQHGGREDDLQNWLAMTSHENPLLVENYFSQNHRGYFKNYRINTRLVCTYFNT